jgi:hypothetical protein
VIGPNDVANPGSAMPEVPPLRSFKVVRMKPGSQTETEEVIVHAHSVQFAGPILQFVTYMVLNGEPGGVTKRGFFGWCDYEDISLPDSGIVVAKGFSIN